jgi:hypothetical protein
MFMKTLHVLTSEGHTWRNFVFGNIKKLRNEKPPVNGIEFLVDLVLLILRWFSVSYWIRYLPERWENPRLRNNIVDAYCSAEFVVLCTLLVYANGRLVDTIVCVYVLFEIYLSLFNILFIGKFRDINYKPPSIERVLLLMFLNVLQLVVAFAVLYRAWSPSAISWDRALSQAIRVLGTVEAPTQTRALVDLQILLDLLLLVIFLASFVGQVGVFRDAPVAKSENHL